MTETQNNKPKMGKGTGIVVGIISFLVIYFLFLKNDKNDSSAVKSEELTKTENKAAEQKENVPTLSVTSTDLYQAYEANEVSADNTYKGKKLEITGKVISIQKNPIDENEIIVKLNGLKDNEYEIMGVSCHFDGSNTNETAKLSKGEKITIIGLCDGSLMGVKLKECSLKK
jgi:hypothetical protein